MSDTAATGTPAVPGTEKLAGCPSEEHVRWVVSHNVPGASPADPDTLVIHSAVAPEWAVFGSQVLHSFSRGPEAIVEVTGWRRGSEDSVIVEYRGADGRPWEHHYDLAHDGRLEIPRRQRALGGIEISACRPGELSCGDRSALFDVFDATYESADHGYLEEQLESFDSVGLAKLEGRVVGFSICDTRQLDLPVIGVQVCLREGLSCVLPDVRRGGVMLAMAFTASQRSVFTSGYVGFSLLTQRLATPASLNGVMPGLQRLAWPTADDPFALYDHPTSTQIAVARAIAVDLGSADYDPTAGICVGSGRPIGTPLVEPEVAPDIAARFDPVDRDRGDSLLFVSWVVPPPQLWFT